MVTKVLTIASVALLALALVGGSAYILLRPTDGEGAVGCQSHAGAAGALQSRNGQGASGERAGGSSGRGQTGAETAGQRGGRGGWSATGAEADHPLETWVTVTGTVVALAGSELTVKSADGVFIAELGPARYWETNGVTLAVGDEVELTGFEADGVFQAARVVDLTTGQTALLRDETGRPLWAGRGRRGG